MAIRQSSQLSRPPSEEAGAPITAVAGKPATRSQGELVAPSTAAAGTGGHDLPAERRRLIYAALRELVGDLPAGSTLDDLSASEVIAVVSGMADRFNLGERPRFVVRKATGHVAVYLGLFAPPSGWVLEDGSGSDALVWERQGVLFADVVSIHGPSVGVWSSGVKATTRSLVRDSHAISGDSFLGARVVALTAPGCSLLVDSPTAPPRLLIDTDLWFAPPVLAVGQLAAEAAGGAR